MTYKRPNPRTKLSILTRPDLKDKIVELFNKGLSYSEIGAVVGGNRNQIAGLVNRLRAAGFISESKNTMHKKPKPQRPPKQKPAPKNESSESFVFAPIINKPKRMDKNVTLLELEPRQCRYPVHSIGSNHLFCGELDTGDSQYCQIHKNLCIVPAKIVPKKHAIRR